MNGQETLSQTQDPFRVLGLSNQASEDTIRSRYLELVKQFPPDRDPARFREIHAAYEAARDPLVNAAHLTQPPDDQPVSWSEVIDEQKARPPRLSAEFLLSLGNRNELRME